MQKRNRGKRRNERREVMFSYRQPIRAARLRGVRGPLLPIIYQIDGEVWDEKCPAGPEVGGELPYEGGDKTVSNHGKRYAAVRDSFLIQDM